MERREDELANGEAMAEIVVENKRKGVEERIYGKVLK